MLAINLNKGPKRSRRLRAVLQRTASKRSTLYDWISNGVSAPRSHGPRRVAWRTRGLTSGSPMQ